MSSSAQSDRTRVRRIPDRGHYDKETLYSIVDSSMLCHVGFEIDGQPFVMPTLVARDGDSILLHGSSASRMMRFGTAGGAMCIEVTHVDGIVMARSVFHHSINYRSAVIFGKARGVTEYDAKMDALEKFTEKLIPGRWNDSRLPTPNEMKATSVIAIDIDEASSKIRTGHPGDDEEDYALPYWAGVLPMRQVFGAPIDDARLTPGIPVPEYVTAMVDK